MKTNFNNSWRKTLFFAFLIVTSTTLYNCSNDDDNPGPDPITEEEIDEAFEEGVDEFPEVEDEDPEFEEPDTSAEADTPVATTDAGADLSSATSVEDLDDATIEILDDVDAVESALPAAAVTYASGLTADDIDELLDLDADLPDGIDADAIYNALSPEVVALLPTITFDFGTGASASSLEDINTVSSLNVGVDFDPIAQDIGGSCEELWQSRYEAVVSALEATRDEQLATVLANFERRNEAAATREADRMAGVDEDAVEFSSEITAIADEILESADNLEGRDDEIRLLAFLVAIEGRRQLSAWYDAAMVLIQNTRASEETTIEGIREDKEDEITTNFNMLVDQAMDIRNTGAADCHNQGAGS